MVTVLTDGATFKCPHGGTVTVSGSTKITVNGNTTVVIASDVVGKTISGCTWAPPPQQNVPCTSVASMSSGAATETTAGGVAVVLSNAVFVTNGAPGPFTLTINEPQTKLTST